MHIRVTTDPISQKDIADVTGHPCHYDGDGQNGLEIYFENQANMDEFLEWEYNDDHQITLEGNDSADYVAEG
ncbi:hypothetical protein MNBD_GAMMA10-899 [hydrothermal vent metagenome]|uniref:Uncharacterized protein n=1 Tax=hydrothermal vent metagenome TaxID=652676 RepID=A0A3B0Y0Y4_9ZZZZ